MRTVHKETHLVARIGWLRAAVLGANDGIISTASLILGVASAASNGNEALVAGVRVMPSTPEQCRSRVWTGNFLLVAASA